MKDWEHPPQSYEFLWKLSNFRLAKDKTNLIKQPNLKVLIDKFFSECEIKIDSDKLRKATIHGDLNELNVLI